MVEIVMNLPVVPLTVMSLVVVLTLVVVRRRGTHTPARLGLLGLTLLSIGGVFVIALLRFRLPVDVAGAFRWNPDGVLRFVTDVSTSEEIWLNVLLFVPACFFLTLYSTRPAIVLLAGIGSSVLAECIQGAFHTGAPDPSDVIANSLGSVIGTLLGSVVLLRSAEHRSRRVVVPATALAVLLIGATACVPLAAGVYQASYTRAVEHNLGSISYAEMEAMKTSTDAPRAWQAGRSFPDGNYYRPSEDAVRWPSSFFFVQQCILATWRPSGLKVEARSGAICREQWG